MARQVIIVCLCISSSPCTAGFAHGRATLLCQLSPPTLAWTTRCLCWQVSVANDAALPVHRDPAHISCLLRYLIEMVLLEVKNAAHQFLHEDGFFCMQVPYVQLPNRRAAEDLFFVLHQSHSLRVWSCPGSFPRLLHLQLRKHAVPDFPDSKDGKPPPGPHKLGYVTGYLTPEAAVLTWLLTSTDIPSIVIPAIKPEEAATGICPPSPSQPMSTKSMCDGGVDPPSPIGPARLLSPQTDVRSAAEDGSNAEEGSTVSSQLSMPQQQQRQQHQQGEPDVAEVYAAVRPSGSEPAWTRPIPELRPTLRPYQARALAWMVSRENTAQVGFGWQLTV